MSGPVQAWLDRQGRWRLSLVAVMGSALLSAGSPPSDLTWMIWLGFAPIWLAVQAKSMTVRRALWLGWVGGLCVGFGGFPWIAELLVRFAEAPWFYALLGLSAFSAWTAVPYGLWAVGVHLGPRTGWTSIAWPAVLWVGLAASWPAIFPYTMLLGFAETPPWMQAAEIGGVGLVEAQVVACGVLLGRAILGSGRDRVVGVLAAVGLVAVSYGLGSWRMAAMDAQAEQARRVKFGVVQPNTPLMWSDRRAKVDRLHAMSVQAQARGAQVVVWPEAGVYPYRIKRPMVRDSPHRRRSIMREHRLPTIFGAATYDDRSPWEYNTVYNMRIDGTIEGYFDKVNLMPFGEYIPVVDPIWAQRQIPAMAHNNAGEGPARFSVEPAPTGSRPDPGPPVFVGPLVCYEDIFPNFARHVAAQTGGIDAYVNVTIDTWFGDTAEPWEHLALAQFRSVEHRIPMVRSVSAGVSSIIDHNGRLVAHLGVTDPREDAVPPAEVLVYDVALPRNTATSPTIYARGGWLFAPLCQLGVLLMLAWGLKGFYSARAKSAAIAAAHANQDDPERGTPDPDSDDPEPRDREA